MCKLGLTSLAGQDTPPASSVAAQQGFWWTRYDRQHEKYHTLDYVLLSSGLRDGATFWVDYTDLNSDHHLVGTEFSCPRQLTRRRGRKKVRRRFKFEQLIQKSSKEADVASAKAAREEYSECLSKEFEGFDPDTIADTGPRTCACVQPVCACAVVQDFIRRVEAACEASVGSVIVGRKFSRSWWDEEVKVL